MTSSKIEEKPALLPEQIVGDYVVITPAFNEQENIKVTVESMVSQEVKPHVWVIVDDGSSDRTWEIVSEMAKFHPWIELYHRPKNLDCGEDGLLVASEAEAFLEGLRIALGRFSNPDFIVKLDADLKFSPDYFSQLFEEFAANPKLGIAGGVIFEHIGTKLLREKSSTAHVRGATKVYRRACYGDIKGIRPIFGWDVIDEVLALAAGWDVASFEHIPLVHLRRTATRGGRFTGWARNGYMAYYVGMSPFRMFLRVCFRLICAGDLIQASGLAYGYFSSFFQAAQKLPDAELRKLVRQHQWVTARASLRVQSLNEYKSKVMRCEKKRNYE